MNEIRVIGKQIEGRESDGHFILFSILADAEIEESTYTVGYHTETKEWTDVEWIALFLKWMPYMEIKEYGESIDVPPELVAEIKRKQKEYDESHPQTEDL
jgi:hypothetical protein